MTSCISSLAALSCISTAQFHNELANGANIQPALVAAIAVIKAGGPRVLIIPYRAGGWTIDQAVLFDLSDFTLVLQSDIRMTSTTRQTSFLFAYDAGQQPAQSIKNVTVIGNGYKIDGNGALMPFTYTHGDGSDNNSSIRFNYVDGLHVEGVHATNGPIDCFSIRQCRNWLVSKCEFSFSKEDNGFSATTDWPTYVYGDPDTCGYGSCVDCISHDNEDFGMTAYNCSNVWFERGKSWRNRAGYSYEDAYTVKDIKKFDGGFLACYAFNCTEQGFYIDADGVTVDDNCKSWNIRGYVGDNSGNLFENGVVVSQADRVYVGGDHRKNGRAGLAIFNGNGLAMNVKAGGKFNDNDWHGIYGRGIRRLEILGKAEAIGNGKVLVASAYGRGVHISNSGGANYLQDAGWLKVHPGASIRENGLGGIRSEYIKYVNVAGVDATENCASGSDIGINLYNATIGKIINCDAPNTTGNQTFAYAIQSSVSRGYMWGNTGDGSSGVESNQAATFSQVVRGEFYATATYDPPSIAAATASAPGRTSTAMTIGGLDIGDAITAIHFPGRAAAYLDWDWDIVGAGANNVVIYLKNPTNAAVDLASGTLRVWGKKRNGG